MSRARQLADLGGDTANLEDISSVLSSGPLSNRNLIINGAMQVAQRGTSVTGSTAGGAYLAIDRWATHASGATYNISQETVTVGGETGLPTEFTKYLRFNATTGANNCGTWQTIEYVQRVQGTYTISFYAKGTNPSGGAVALTTRQSFGSGGSAEADVTVNNFTLTSSWQRFTFTVSIPSVSGKTIGTSSYFRIFIHQPDADNTSNAWTIDLTGVQLEVGDTATPFEHRSYGQELALCQRYYQRWEDNGTTWLIATGHANTNTIAQFAFRFNGVMRAAPTMSSGGNTSAFHFGSYAQSSYESSIPLFELTTPHATRIRDNTFGSLNGDSATFAYMLGGNGGYIEANAEL